MKITGDLREFIELQTLLSNSDPDYATSEPDLAELAEAFRECLRASLFRRLKADELVNGQTLVYAVRRELKPLPPPLQDRLNVVTKSERERFESEFKLHVTEASFARRNSEIEACVAAGNRKGAAKLAGSLILDLYQDPAGSDGFNAARRRWGHLVDVVRVLMDSEIGPYAKRPPRECWEPIPTKEERRRLARIAYEREMGRSSRP
jgi:hypothetical protein